VFGDAQIIVKIREDFPGLNDLMVSLDDNMSAKGIRNIIGEFAKEKDKVGIQI
jgi:dTDP-glucose pyrophosphorylase